MNAQMLTSYREQFQAVSDKALGICRNYAEKAPEFGAMATEFENFAKARLADLQPKIMVYGIYNAGKSTLLNALMGDARAPMNDIPTTYRIDSYKWKEYTIYDTPGIDAPEKDEEVSKEQLRKSDVIIFVMGSEGNVDYSKNYRELADIVESGKHILLVINNKSGNVCNSDDPEVIGQFALLKQQVYHNFIQACGNNLTVSHDELAQRYPICIVDAKMALKARTDSYLTEEKRRILLEASNILELEKQIVAEYKKTSGATIINSLQNELKKKLNDVRCYLENSINDATAKRGSRDIAEIQNQQDDLIARITDFARREEAGLENSIYAIFDNVKQEGEQENVKAQIEELVEKFIEKVNIKLHNELEKVCNRIQDIATKFAEFSVQAVKPGTEVVIPVENKADVMVCENLTGSGLDTARKIMIGSVAVKGAAVALPKLLLLLPKVGTLLLPVVGPVLGVVAGVLASIGALLGFRRGSSANDDEFQRRRAEAERQIAIENEKARVKQEKRRLSAQIAADVVSGVLNQIEEFVSKEFTDCIEKIREICRLADSETGKVQDDLAELRKIDEFLCRRVD